MRDAGTDATVLRRAAQHLRTGFDEAATGMAVTALDGRYLRVNPAFCALVGRDEQQLLTMTRQDLTHPDDTSEADARTDAAVERGAQAVLVDKRYLHADGREIRKAICSTNATEPLNLPLRPRSRRTGTSRPNRPT